MPFTKCEESDDENLGHYEKVLKNRQIHKTSSISNMVQRGHSLSGHSEDRTNYDPFLNQRNQVQYKNIK